MNVRAAACVLLASLAACATETPVEPGFDSSAGLVVIDVAADGFVRMDGRRMPLEAAVLALRQRTRKLNDDQVARFVVHLRTDAQAEGSDAARAVLAGINRLTDELQIMTVEQVKLL